MSRTQKLLRGWLLAAVSGHLVVSLVHGAAHRGAQVALSPAASGFVVVVILAAPVIGLALTRVSARVGGWVVACALFAAFAFGVINHFILSSADHVAVVDAGWRPLFAATAVLLAITEAVGAGLALQIARDREPVA